MLVIFKLLEVIYMLRTYEYTETKGKPRREVGISLVSAEDTHKALSVLESSLRKEVIEYDLFGCGWRDLKSGKAWMFGCMDGKMMRQMDKDYDKQMGGTIL